MLNAICNRKKLARTSKTPGRTQLINFLLSMIALALLIFQVMGYASTSKNLKHMERYGY